MKFKFNPDIFRAYDIRGIYPKEINEEAAYLVGRAFVKFLDKKNLKIVVGRDNRLSSPCLFHSLTRGITDEGANVIDIGLSPSPMFYFSVANFGFDAGINVTASHNPPQYNGFKLVREKAIPISEMNGLKKIKSLALANSFISKKKGRVFKKKVLPEYVKFILQKTKSLDKRPLKIVIDTANAVAGMLIPEVFKKTNHQIYHLFSKLDGSFPNHNPDPLVKENLRVLSKTVKNKKADFGAAFDGDGDRVFFLDEKGEVVPGDLITALLADLLLREKRGAKIFYDIRSNNIVGETIKKAGGIPIAGRIGHSFIKEKMRRENILFGGELSGHYYFKESYFCESPLSVLFGIISEISERKKPLSEIISPFERYFHSGEINFRVKDKKGILKRIEKNPPSGGEKGKISKLDGLRIDFKDWWFLVRVSGTEPLLRLVLEAKTEKLMREKKKSLSKLIAD